MRIPAEVRVIFAYLPSGSKTSDPQAVGRNSKDQRPQNEQTVRSNRKSLPKEAFLGAWILAKASGTQGRTRTGTPVKAGDFESPASTIPPLGLRSCGLPKVTTVVQPEMTDF